MMRGRKSLFRFVEFKSREIHHPYPRKFGRWSEFQIAGQLQSQFAENLVDDLRLVSRETEEIAVFGAGSLDEFGGDGREEFRNAGVESGCGYFGNGQSLRTETLCPFSKGIRFLTAEFPTAGNGNRLNHRGVLENAEIGLLPKIGDVMQFHAEPEVRPV